ncbi:hypothetical protein GOP47_0008242 [Adiantum capillus-veneris]|uniref:Uncharacterized protein n=1 Tax=Adiantum capillus-veneris TaxID=13818 RepID=A0A9D4ZJH6_ADICA|nr:hypothetical protein GOP47_0008242 [Adiantum capillus-veneris]
MSNTKHTKGLYLKWNVGPTINSESEIISSDDDDAVKVQAMGKRSLAQSLLICAEEVQTINKRIQLIHTPTGYGASCRNMFNLDDKSLSGLKTHYWHNFVKHILPLVIDGCTTQGVRDVIYQFRSLARFIC